MAKIPGTFIKDKIVDYEGELVQLFGKSLRLGGLFVPPVPIGVWSLFEMMDSRWITCPAEARIIDIARVLYACCEREKAVDAIYDWVKSGEKEKDGDEGKISAFDRIVFSWFNASGVDISADNLLRFNDWLNLGFSGYEMIPPGPGGNPNALWRYGADTVAGMVAMACASLNCSLFEAMWRVPVCLIGHLTAHKARTASAESASQISRPKDPADIRKKLKEANEREARGELHPWQIVYWDLYPILPLQKEANPAIVEELEKQKARLKEIGVDAMLKELKDKGLIDV